METVDVKSVDDIRKLIDLHGLSPTHNTKARDLLLEGFELIRHRIEYNNLINSDLNVDDMGGWIHQFVRDKLGGKIAGDKVTWTINSQTVIMNPVTCEITCE